jgi:hypothetical protein
MIRDFPVGWTDARLLLAFLNESQNLGLSVGECFGIGHGKEILLK